MNNTSSQCSIEERNVRSFLNEGELQDALLALFID